MGVAYPAAGFSDTSPASSLWDPRSLIIGDSHLQMGWTDNAGNVNRLDFTGGIGTLNFSGNCNILLGNKFTLINQGTAGTMDISPVNCGEFTALTMPSSTQVTFNATLNGVTPPDGATADSCVFTGSVTGTALTVSSVQSGTVTTGMAISGTGISGTCNINSGTFPNFTLSSSQTVAGGTTMYGAKNWRTVVHTRGRDSGLIQWFNAFANNPFTIVHNFTCTSASSSQYLSVLGRIQSQAPKSTYANLIISLGSNSAINNLAATGLSYQAMETEFSNVVRLADALYSTGKVFIVFPIGGTVGFNGAANVTRAISYFRRKFAALRRPYRIVYLDVFGMSIDGNDPSGYPLALYQGSQNHSSVYAMYKMGKQSAAWLNSETRNVASSQILRNMSHLDDGQSTVAAWVTAKAYVVGDVVKNGTRTYICSVAGTSSVAPTTDAVSIADGATLRWDCLYGPWTTGISYTAGKVRTSNGFTYVATNNATSGATPPNGDVVGFSDGGVTWDCIGPLWTASTAYTVGKIRMNNHMMYICTTAGTSASSGGPSGDRKGVQDGTCVWDSLGPYQGNLASNFSSWLASGGSNTNVAATGTVPGNWAISNSTPQLTSITSGVSAVTVKPAGTEAVPGVGWDLSLVFPVSPASLTLTQTIPAADAPKPGMWYTAKITVNGKTALNTALKEIGFYCRPNGFPVLFDPSAMLAGNNTTTIPLDVTDSYDIVIPPFKIPENAPAITSCTLFVQISAISAGGTVNLQLSNLEFRACRDPSLEAPSSYQ